MQFFRIRPPFSVSLGQFIIYWVCLSVRSSIYLSVCLLQEIWWKSVNCQPMNDGLLICYHLGLLLIEWPMLSLSLRNSGNSISLFEIKWKPVIRVSNEGEKYLGGNWRLKQNSPESLSPMNFALATGDIFHAAVAAWPGRVQWRMPSLLRYFNDAHGNCFLSHWVRHFAQMVWD